MWSVHIFTVKEGFTSPDTVGTDHSLTCGFVWSQSITPDSSPSSIGKWVKVREHVSFVATHLQYIPVLSEEKLLFQMPWRNSVIPSSFLNNLQTPNASALRPTLCSSSRRTSTSVFGPSVQNSQIIPSMWFLSRFPYSSPACHCFFNVALVLISAMAF